MILDKIKLYTSDIYFLGIFFGILTTPIFNILGVYSEARAIEYYGEVHTSVFNSFIHTLFMPFTYYGLLLSVPGIIFKNEYNISLLQRFLYVYFITYYLTLNIFIGLLIAIYYLPSQIMAENYYKRYSFNRIVTIAYGISVAVIALTIQEVIGHWIGGDDPSRLEAIPNAIWHAGYYSVYHIFY